MAIQLTIYKIRRFVDGAQVVDFDDVIAVSADVASYELKPNLGFEGRIYASQTDPKRPSWADFVQAGSADGIDEIDTSRSFSALVILRRNYRRRDHYFAAVFGAGGRFLLKPGSYELDFGLKIALNTIYEHGGGQRENSRIRSIDARKVAGEVFNSRVQASRRTSFESFELDTDGDQLRSITGRPADDDRWGARITGAAAVSLKYNGVFDGLGDFCVGLQSAFARRDYQENFAWVDHIKGISDTGLKEGLRTETVEAVKSSSPDLAIVPIRILNWDEIDAFQITGTPGGTISARDPDDLMPTLVQQLEAAGRLSELTRERLAAYRLAVLDSGGNVVNSDSLFNCIEGELESAGSRYLITEGEFFEIDRSYLAELNAYVDRLPLYSGGLVSSTATETEGDYNERASDASPDHLMLDRQTVRIPGKTTAIEVCDILTRAGHFIHAKRKLGSSSLSHLFAQGLVSADLFMMSRDYRRAVRDKIAAAAAERAAREAGFRTNFLSFNMDSPAASRFEVVYAIIADWRGRAASEAIPFFSKVNLRRHCTSLRRMGLKSSLAKVEAL